MTQRLSRNSNSRGIRPWAAPGISLSILGLRCILKRLQSFRAAGLPPRRLRRLSPSWAEAHIKIARMTLTIKLDRNWNSFQLANSTPPLSVTDSAIAPSARMANLPAVHNTLAHVWERGRFKIRRTDTGANVYMFEARVLS